MAEFRFPEVEMHYTEIAGYHLLIGPFAGGVVSTDSIGAQLLLHSAGRTAGECRAWISEQYGAKHAYTADDLEAFVRTGCLNPVELDPLPDDPPVTVVHLSLTNRCNIACRYCFAKDARGTVPDDMTFDTARAAISMFAERLRTEPQTLLIQCSSAGESLVRLDLLLEVGELAKDEAARTGVPIRVGATSNGVLMDRETVRRLTEAGVVPSLSWGGPPEIHDAHRVRPDGSGTQADVAAAFRTILEVSGEKPPVGATVTGENPDVTGVFKHLFEQGVGCFMIKPVRHADPKLGVSDQTLAAFQSAYADYAEFLLSPGPDRFERLCALTTGDFLWRFVDRVAKRTFGVYRCPAGRSSLCVDTNGDIYPCQDFQGIPEHRMGSVFTGVDSKARGVYLQDLVCTKMTPCSTCWARYFCGGGCYAQSLRTMGAIDTPYVPDCELKKRLIELAAYLVTRLESERPGLLRRVFRFHDPETGPGQPAIMAVRQPLGCVPPVLDTGCVVEGAIPTHPEGTRAVDAEPPPGHHWRLSELQYLPSAPLGMARVGELGSCDIAVQGGSSTIGGESMAEIADEDAFIERVAQAVVARIDEREKINLLAQVVLDRLHGETEAGADPSYEDRKEGRSP